MKNTTIFITGATSGIGASCALAFAAPNTHLILTGRNQETLNEIVTKAKNQGAQVTPLLFDVRDRESIKQQIQTLPPSFKNIDILINNAGLALGLAKVAECDLNDWDTMIDTNIKSLAFITHLLLPNMLKQQKGHIINIGSTAGDEAYAKGAMYCATKAAVKVFTDGLRIDLADTPLKVTDVKPGLVKTNFSNTRFHGDHSKAEQVYQGIDYLKPEDIADIVKYIAYQPPHVQIGEISILATNQGNGYTIARK